MTAEHSKEGPKATNPEKEGPRIVEEGAKEGSGKTEPMTYEIDKDSGKPDPFEQSLINAELEAKGRFGTGLNG